MLRPSNLLWAHWREQRSKVLLLPEVRVYVYVYVYVCKVLLLPEVRSNHIHRTICILRHVSLQPSTSPSPSPSTLKPQPSTSTSTLNPQPWTLNFNLALTDHRSPSTLALIQVRNKSNDAFDTSIRRRRAEKRAALGNKQFDVRTATAG